jgi:hypothetical protein
MRYILQLVLLTLTSLSSKAQHAAGIISELKLINTKVAMNQFTRTGAECKAATDTSPLISKRAMNIFLADKTGYLAEHGDLSYYTNYVTLNSSGVLTVNHNNQKAKGIDEPIESLFGVGAKANIANAFNSTFVDKKFENELGLTLTQTWLGKVRTRHNACKNVKEDVNQKQAMDALRAGMLHLLEIEINEREEDFKKAIAAIDSTNEVPGQGMQAPKSLLEQSFYEELKEEYEKKFAMLQAERLTKTKNFKLITTHWTSLMAYLPLAYPKYNIAPSLTLPIFEEHPYPFELTLSHTRLWESSTAGRLFVTISGKLLGHNTAQSFELDKTTVAGYKNLGGTDTLRLALLKNDEVYIGDYKTFINPVLTGRVVYFTSESHIGLSVLLEKNFGGYNLVNGRLGIPLVLINSRKTPALNIEFQLALFDMTREINSTKKYGNNTSVGVGIGIPLSRLMY